ncbi:hypothetical protein [Pseudomonas sp.]|uniref:hypothetical protein n=1 Tax=Pseudomonas sp. TaxID=306 RepID=UPI0028A167E7|nr:hypothetical protein [Pseudomonas sp.]
MLMQTREYNPIAALPVAAPVKFQVSPFSLYVDIGQPHTKLAAPLSQVRFENDHFGLERQPVIRVIGGVGTDLFWQVTLHPEDAEDLRALIAEILDAAKSL